MTRNRRSVAASCGLALCALVTTSVTAGSAPAAGGLVKRCGKVAAGFSLTRIDTADGAHLIGAQRGSGRIGIVFVHQSGGDLYRRPLRFR